MSNAYDYEDNEPVVETEEQPADTGLIQKPVVAPPKFGWEDQFTELTETPNNEPYPEPKAKKVRAKRKVVKAKAAKKPAKRAKATITLDDFGFRKGTLRSKAAAMYASPKGATLAEVRTKLGSIQYNMLTDLKKRGFKITSKEIEGKANRPATKYFLSPKKR